MSSLFLESRPSMTKTFKLSLVSTLISCTVGMASASELVRLIDTSGVPPSVPPSRVTATPSFHGDVADLFQWLQPVLVDWAVSIEQSRLIADAMKEAVRTGQAGVLLKVRISKANIGDQIFYYPVGTGVTIVGIGPNTDAVCYAEQCFNALETSPNNGTKLDYFQSEYVWVGVPDSTKQWHYSIPAVDQRAQTARLYNGAQSAYAQSVSGQYLAGYASQLAAKLSTEEGRDQVRGLLQRNEEAIAQLTRVEAELAENLVKAKRAANASSVFDTLSGVFSMAANVAMFSSMVGTDLKTPEGKAPLTKEDLRNAIKAVDAGAVAAIKALQEQRMDYLNRYDASRQKIIQLGSENGMGGNGGVLYQLH